MDLLIVRKTEFICRELKINSIHTKDLLLQTTMDLGVLSRRPMSAVTNQSINVPREQKY